MLKNSIRLFGGIALLGLVACGHPTPPATQLAVINPLYGQNDETNTTTLVTNRPSEDQVLYDLVFQELLDSLQDKSPLEFSSVLDSVYQLGGISGQKVRQQEMYGRSDSIWMIEVTYPIDTVCANYPYKQQLFFGADGKLFHKENGEKIQFLEVWEDKPPVLMVLNADCYGSGARYLYKYENGRMVNIFNLPVANEQQVMTYDGLEDSTVYYPKELVMSLEDVDMDGDNDLVFEGQKLWLEDNAGKRYPKYRPYKRMQVRYEFIYNKGKDLFTLR